MQRKSTADRVNYSKVFEPGDDTDGIPYEESIDWLSQFFPVRQMMILTDRRIFLLVGDETYPLQIWSMRYNHYRGTCYLEWEREPESETN